MNRLQNAVGRASSHFDDAHDVNTWQHKLLRAAKELVRTRDDLHRTYRAAESAAAESLDP